MKKKYKKPTVVVIMRCVNCGKVLQNKREIFCPECKAEIERVWGEDSEKVKGITNGNVVINKTRR